MLRSIAYRLRLILLLALSGGSLLAQTWEWSRGFGGVGTEVLGAMEIAADGKVLLAGSYQESIDLGATTLSSIGEGDVFLAQLSVSGNVEWAVSGGSESNDHSLALTSDADGNILWLGQYWVRAYFGADSIDSGVNSKAYFLAKYSPQGNLLWLQNIRGTSTKVVSDVSLNGEDIYLAGYFSDSLFINDSVLVATAQEDAFVWKLSSDGTVQWGARYGDSGRIRPNKIESSPDGDLVIAGDIEGSVTFGQDVLNSVTTDFDIFVAKVDAQGAGLWGQIGTGVFDDFLRSLRVDDSGSIYLSGHFIGVLDMDGNAIATPGFVDNLYLIKLDAEGTVTWIRALDASMFNEPSLSFDIALWEDKVWMTGQFLEELLIDDLTLEGEAYFQGFVAAFDTSTAAVETLVLIPGNEQTSGRLLEAGVDGRIFLGGVFVDSLTLSSEEYSSAGGTDIFLAELGDDLTQVLDQRQSDQRIKIYPNPVDEYLYHDIPIGAYIDISIIDIRGTIHVRSRNTTAISVGHLPPGWYYFVVRGKNVVTSLPFFKL